MKRPCVLVVDDDRRYRELIDMNLSRRGYAVLSAEDGLNGLNLLERDSPDLVILDVMLPDLDGFEVCRRIRAYSDVPVIMLTARAEESDIVNGLNIGADDYITKPFGAEEMVARVEAALRRGRPTSEIITPPPFVNGDLTIDFARRRVTLRGVEIHLPPTEYKLLLHLALNAGRILVHEELLRRVWGPGYESDIELLHTTVRRLRRKLDDQNGSTHYIRNRRGIGYQLVAPIRV